MLLLIAPLYIATGLIIFYIRWMERKYKPAAPNVSETSKIRHLVLKYCIGYGCDVGFGGDKIKPDAVGIDLPTPYTAVGSDTVDIGCDVTDGIPVEDKTYDYVYTSHLIEDIPYRRMFLSELSRITKDGGIIILVFPDEKRYREHCKKTGQPRNGAHVYDDLDRDDMVETIGLSFGWRGFKIIYNTAFGYSEIIVLQLAK